MTGLSFEATVARLTRLAAGHGGTVAAADVENDESLGRDRSLTCAAARMLAGAVHVVPEATTEQERWFPFARLTFTGMPGGAVGRGAPTGPERSRHVRP